VVGLEEERKRGQALTRRVEALRDHLKSVYLDDGEAAELRRGEARLVRSDRRRDLEFQEILELVRRAERLDPDLRAGGEVRAALYGVRMRQAEDELDAVEAGFWRSRAVRESPAAAPTSEQLRVVMESDPPGAEVHLFRYREQAELFEDGERRLVPVPLGRGPSPLAAGTIVLRVVGGPLAKESLVLRIAGQPIEGSVFALDDREPLRRGDRLVAVDGDPVRSLWRCRQIPRGPHRLEFDRSGGAHEREVTEFPAAGLRLGDAADLAAEGGVPARVWESGVVRDFRLPAGLEVRTTATPLVVGPASRVGVTPLPELLLERGEYLALLVLPNREPVRFPFALERDRVLRVPFAPRPGRLPGYRWVPLGEEPFWIEEHEVTCGEYLAFLNDPENALRLRTPGDKSLVPRVPRLSGADLEWPRDTQGRFALPGWIRPEWPVFGLDFDAAGEYAKWRTRAARAAGVPVAFALPTYSEWQRAAGRLRRYYVFGNTWWPRWVNCVFSRPSPRPGLEPVMSYPVDESPLGAFDMSGSVYEWLDDWYDEKLGARRLGGCAWSQGDPEQFKVCGGLGVSPATADGQTGFRLVARPAGGGR
jgi:hypothetical protein